ncbi:MAG: UDP-glucose--hexose-1-phosphate uridylyltransferase [Gammaproteobacteria bacterium]|nr:UDP-glucose--hexose-1-phosphate uridylyltransferase [Gammaproteobacteria bacterium]
MALMDPLREHPHRRLNALTGEWLTVSPHRTLRPWQGRIEPPAAVADRPYDPQCYLCPGNARAGGVRNPDYTSTFAFTNDYPALLPEGPVAGSNEPLLQAQAMAGTCRVLCYSPRHDRSLSQLPLPQIQAVVELWAGQSAELGERWRWVQVFENRGELMGCSNPHPHGQVWAADALPNEPTKELQQQRAWRSRHARPLLIDYARREIALGERIVAQTAHWLAVVPWWAVWPFETLLLPLDEVSTLPALDHGQRADLASLLHRVLGACDRLFDAPFPYSMGWHGAPGGTTAQDGWVLHAHLYPPLLRSATVRKFFVGYEMLAEPQRDLTAEQAAERLRACVQPPQA